MRASGMLLPVTSLPSNYGVGTLGKAAYEFVNFLEKAGQSYWQVLPVGPTGFADSPYQSFSAFAGNPYLIDLDMLVKDGLLKEEEIGEDWGKSETKVDYGLLFECRFEVLQKAVERQNKTAPAYLAFAEDNAYWLDDYALFMAIKEANGNESFTLWPLNLRMREENAMKKALALHGARAEFWKCLQYFFYKQWDALKEYANAKGIKIIGDIPIYVSPDSSDLWANPQLFQVDGEGLPTAVAGVPPDSFSADGQHWGNPLYDWHYHRKTKYQWWIKRMKAAEKLYDVVRIDHFRGFAGYYSIPAGETTAKNGQWEKGPGKDFIKHIKKALPDLSLIAEDLGVLTPDVYELMEYSAYPGMEVLQFAFNPGGNSDYLPHNYEHNTIVYTGTHDNMTTAQWVKQADKEEVDFAAEYLGATKKDKICEAMIRAAYMSVADTVIIPAQDWLNLGATARINTPATIGGNWDWRLAQDQLDMKLCDKIYQWTYTYSRLNPEIADKNRNGALTAEEIGKAEQAAVKKGTSLEKLMENAGQKAAAELLKLAGKDPKSILMLCGKGNNTGDAFVMAAELAQKGWNVGIVPVFGKETEYSPLALANYKKLPKEVKIYESFEETDFKADYIVDGIFGIGFEGEMHKDAVPFIGKANAADAVKIALDIPSGIYADNGDIAKAVFKANYTYTFGYPKYAFNKAGIETFTGEIIVLDIGI